MWNDEEQVDPIFLPNGWATTVLVRNAFFITLVRLFKMEFWSVCPSRLLFWGEGYTFLFLCWLMECGCYCFSPLTRRATLLLASFSRCKDTARILYHTNTNVAFTYNFVTFVTFLRIYTYKKRFYNVQFITLRRASRFFLNINVSLINH